MYQQRHRYLRHTQDESIQPGEKSPEYQLEKLEETTDNDKIEYHVTKHQEWEPRFPDAGVQTYP